MHHTGGPGWRITMDCYGPLLIALYIRDVSGLGASGEPAVSPAVPEVHAASHHHLTAEVGGEPALRTEWEAWWHQLLRQYPAQTTELQPPGFPAFQNSPALRRVMQAHFGAALAWGRDRLGEYVRLEAERDLSGANRILADLMQDRELELGRSARDFSFSIIELPLSEPRAWFLEPDRMVMSMSLMEDPEAFRSFVQPVVEMLV